MAPIFYFFIFIFGLFVGSFLNCVIYRLETGGNFLKGRSFCPHCKHILGWQDLIPIFSFFILKRKCRYCQQPISLQYPLVELATGFLFALLAQNQLTVNSEQLTILDFLNFCYLLTVTCFLLIIFIYDLKHFIIPDKVIYPAILISFLYNLILNSKFLILNSFPVAFGAAIFFLSIVLISRGKWMGLGDVKLAFLIGLFLGFPNILVGLFFSFLIGAIIGVGLILAKRKTLKSEVPFGPFLVAGTFIALFWGEKIINWYLNLTNLII